MKLLLKVHGERTARNRRTPERNYNPSPSRSTFDSLVPARLIPDSIVQSLTQQESIVPTIAAVPISLIRSERSNISHGTRYCCVCSCSWSWPQPLSSSLWNWLEPWVKRDSIGPSTLAAQTTASVCCAARDQSLDTIHMFCSSEFRKRSPGHREGTVGCYGDTE